MWLDDIYYVSQWLNLNDVDAINILLDILSSCKKFFHYKHAMCATIKPESNK